MKPDPYKKKVSREYQKKHGMITKAPKRRLKLESNEYRYQESQETEEGQDPDHAFQETKKLVEFLESNQQVNQMEKLAENIMNPALNSFLFGLDERDLDAKYYGILERMEMEEIDHGIVNLSDLRTHFLTISNLKTGNYTPTFKKPEDFKDDDEVQSEESTDIDDETIDELLKETEKANPTADIQQVKKEISVIEPKIEVDTKNLEEWLDDVL